MPKKTLPSKSDMLAVLRDCQCGESKKLIRLKAAEAKADAAFTVFKETNATYLRLEREVNKAHTARWLQFTDEHRTRNAEFGAVREMIRLEGPTPKTLAAVRKLTKKYR